MVKEEKFYALPEELEWRYGRLLDPEPGNIAICGACGFSCEVVAFNGAFDYSGPHCTYGKPGVGYMAGHGEPVSDCCECSDLFDINDPIEGD